MNSASSRSPDPVVESASPVRSKKFLEQLDKRRWPSRLTPLKPLFRQTLLLFGIPYRVRYAKLIRAWRRGFSGNKNVLYDFDGFAPEAYLSDAQARLAKKIDGPQGEILNDKIVSFYVFSGLGARTPAIYAEKARGHFVVFDGQGAGLDLEALVRAKGEVVVKPRSDSGGRGFLRLEWRDGRFRVNGEPSDRLPDPGRDYLVKEFVRQHAYAARVYPRTTNTLRLLTMWEDGSDAPFLATAIHRFGTARSFPVDNWGAGGLSAPIDLETGVLGRAAAAPSSNRLEWHELHPETRERIAGLQVPGWGAVKDSVLALAGKLPYLPYVGWDVVVTEAEPVIIEGNSNSDVNLLQIHGPLLADPRVRSFYRSHGVAPG
jgi:Sugar-transfer associated ATP-grasp